MPYQITFAESMRGHLQYLTARERTIALSAIEQQLLHEPLVETRNRKLLRPNPIAPRELRVGAIRIFYDATAAEEDIERVVYILAVGKKDGNILRIAGKEIHL